MPTPLSPAQERAVDIFMDEVLAARDRTQALAQELLTTIPRGWGYPWDTDAEAHHKLHAEIMVLAIDHLRADLGPEFHDMATAVMDRLIELGVIPPVPE